jgi:hypothetical protein
VRSLELDLTRYDTDKVRNRYLERYDPVFEPWVGREPVVLELGVHAGGSLELWRDYFPAAKVVGVDVALPDGFEPGEPIEVFQGSQGDTRFLSKMAAAAAPHGFDIIIDDASHFGELTGISFWHLFENHLKPGGLYAIEDWGTGYFDDWPDGKKLRSMPLAVGSRRRPTLWRRAARTLGFSQRFPSHDRGMVGFIKQLVDEQGAYDATSGSLQGPAERPSRFHKMMIVPSIVFVWKPGGTENRG